MTHRNGTTAGDVGAELRRLREGRPPDPRQTNERRHLSQKLLAARAGIDSGRVCRYEEGERLPDLPTLARLAGALGLGDADVARLVRLAGGEGA